MAYDCTILAPGPSLTLFDGYGPRPWIGVNQAATAFICDYVVFPDRGHTHKPLISEINEKIMGKPVFIERLDDRLRSLFDRDMSVKWYRSSSCTALAWAAAMGKRTPVVYGVDWEGSSNWDNSETELQRKWRHAQRWKGEQVIWDRVIERTGIEPCRISLTTMDAS